MSAPVTDAPRMDVPRAGAIRRGLRALSSVLIVSGLLLLADAGLTVVWQEPLSAIYNHFQQDHLRGQLATLWDEPTPLESRALETLHDDSSRIAFQARALKRKARAGQPIGRIRIPRIGGSLIVVEGTDTASLREGPGHYPQTPLPGAAGTVAIAGHRTTYGAPFRNVNRLRHGDRIEVDMPYAKFLYSVERTKIVDAGDPHAIDVIKRVGYDRLVLTACHPLYSAAQRIVIFARKVSQSPAAGII